MESKCTELVVGAIFVWQLEAGVLGKLKNQPIRLV